ncbi:MAG: hypothetical protein RLZZ352_440 [Pseudomonadota bacterium]|jgi:hypothetical protein
MPATQTHPHAQPHGAGTASAPLAWSGRLDVAERSRPGGLLTAALTQCATERDLSLSQLAQALGVSYWSLSQLRVGLRPIESLDDDVLQGCMALLGLPRLTVLHLAGLLSTDELLAHDDLTAADLLHLREMTRPDPADWVLQPPPNPARALQHLSLDELTMLFQAHADKPGVLRCVLAELESRPPSRAERLRAQLRSALPQTDSTSSRASAAETPPASAVLGCVQCHKRLRVPHLASASEIRCPHCHTEYAVHWQGLVCLVQALPTAAQTDTDTDADEEAHQHHAAPDGSADDNQDPWAVLGLPADSPWPQVERARRSLLQQYHPDRLGHVSPLVRQLAETAFKRVNDAFETLKAQR